MIIPNRPESFGWLTPVERDRLKYVLEQDRFTKDAGDEIGSWDAFKLAVTDVSVAALLALTSPGQSVVRRRRPDM